MGKKWPPRTDGPGVGDSIDRQDKRLLEELRRALASGDREAVDRACEAIYRAYARVVAFVAARFLRDDADVVSVVDDVFIAFFRRAAEEDVGNLRAYLTVAARHRALDVLRAAGRRPFGVVSAPGEDGTEVDPLACIPDPDGDVEASARYRDLIRDLMSVLDAKTVSIILGHAVYGETFAAIGARLGIKESTVKTLYHRGLTTFRSKKGESWL